MKDKKPPDGSDFNDTQSIPIDFTTLLTDDISSSGSFYVKGVQTTSLGKLLQALPIPALLIDQAYRIIFANQACGRTSPACEKIVGTQISELFPNPAKVGDVERVVEEVFSTRKPQVHQALLGIDNNRIWGRMHFRSLRVAEERLILLLIEDLTVENLLMKKYRVELIEQSTERRQAEQALLQSEQSFRAIFEGATDYIFLKDRFLRYTAVNPAVGKLLGISTSEMIGRRYEDLFGKERSEHARETDSRVLQGETVEGEQTRTIRGIPMTFLYTKSPMRDDSGEVIGILAISRDITERKRLEVSCAMTQEYPSKAMQATLRSAILAGKRATTVLLTGESGSGKDYLARYIHDHSDSAAGPYFTVNCAAISEGLAESVLFGHERGAFTGAVGRKRGLLELAEGGTLLLNEIGELSL
jgi:PAS domain S-box-containing protein